eukprot:10546274-Karenia_brevis.AAC.1
MWWCIGGTIVEAAIDMIKCHMRRQLRCFRGLEAEECKEGVLTPPVKFMGGCSGSIPRHFGDSC